MKIKEPQRRLRKNQSCCEKAWMRRKRLSRKLDDKPHRIWMSHILHLLVQIRTTKKKIWKKGRKLR